MPCHNFITGLQRVPKTLWLGFCPDMQYELWDLTHTGVFLSMCCSKGSEYFCRWKISVFDLWKMIGIEVFVQVQIDNTAKCKKGEWRNYIPLFSLSSEIWHKTNQNPARITLLCMALGHLVQCSCWNTQPKSGYVSLSMVLKQGGQCSVFPWCWKWYWIFQTQSSLESSSMGLNLSNPLSFML